MSKKRNILFNNTLISMWFERGGGYVELSNKRTGKTIIQWVDDEIQEAVEDGFLDPKDWHWSAYNYAKNVGIV